MGTRRALLAAAMIAGVASFATAADAAATADECITKPNGVAPAGKHWYYRTNREIKRKCWYLGDNEEVATVAPRKRKTVAPAVEAESDTEEPRQTADARAELVDGPREQLSQPTQPSIWPAPAPPEPQSQPEPQQTTSEVNERGWSVATRWPEP